MDCRNCRFYGRERRVNYCAVPLPPCFDFEMGLFYTPDFMHGRAVYARDACACFAEGAHPTRLQWKKLKPQEASEADADVKTIIQPITPTNAI